MEDWDFSFLEYQVDMRQIRGGFESLSDQDRDLLEHMYDMLYEVTKKLKKIKVMEDEDEIL